MSSPQHYNDGQAEPSDPTDVRSVGFDWEGLEHALGEDELGPVEYQRLAFALGRVLRWIAEPHAGKAGRRNKLRVIGLRTLCVIWTINPEILESDALSLREIDKAYKLGNAISSKQAKRFSQRFQVSNQFRNNKKNKNHANQPRG